ncbi:MAG TPA: A/G-specific adenine glycosylase [Chitinophagales bacterium]|nr:A/G-specific adenine glycosylase [Chitinophagales bacterium]
MNAPFTRLLLTWNKEKNTRQMPWKGEKNPYYIWLSEIILQQTRVEQGLPYFVRFKTKYPTVKQLALAKEDEVMKLWQGLGYYSRARNLHETAKNIHQNFKGIFPNTFDELVKLKGVGDYTASAIASFAFDEKKAVVDGNVIRVLSRVFGIETPFDTTAGKKQFAQLAQELIDDNEPGAYNQAIMDFGAVVCTPQSPKCDTCLLNKICFARQHGLVNELPYREKRTKILPRYFTYLYIKSKNELVIEKRTGNDIWKNLYQLPLVETAKPIKKDFHKLLAGAIGTKEFEIKSYSKEIAQLLSHRKIHFRFVEIELADFKSFNPEGSQKVKLKDLNRYAFPKTIHEFLQQQGHF